MSTSNPLPASSSPPNPKLIRFAVSQSHTLATTPQTLAALEETTRYAASQHVDILLLPEAYLGGYPRGCNFGCAVGSRDPEGREQFLKYWNDSVDLGDTARGEGDDWLKRRLPPGPTGCSYQGHNSNNTQQSPNSPPTARIRGDGTRERLEALSSSTNVFLVVPLIERTAGSLYCTVIYISPSHGTVGKHRKVLPTGTERLIWAQGSPSTLRAVVAYIRGIRVVMGSAICWENYMPLLRQSLYEQGVNLWLAPTADGRPAWEALMRTVGIEGRCWVGSANQCLLWAEAPGWITGRTCGSSQAGEGNDRSQDNGSVNPNPNPSPSPNPDPDPDPNSKSTSPSTSPSTTDSAFDPSAFASRGGSLISSPQGDIVAGPLWEVTGSSSTGAPSPLLYHDIDLDDCIRGRLDLDVAGSYSRNDTFTLAVEGLEGRGVWFQGGGYSGGYSGGGAGA